MILGTTKMSRMTNPLTNTQVKQAKAKEKVYKLSDGLGLQLRVRPNGAKSWLFDYVRPFDKKRTSIGFGSFLDVSLAEARNKRKQARELLAKNIDPKEHREEQLRIKRLSEGETLINVCNDWFKIKKTRVAEVTAHAIWRNFKNHLFPALGNRPISKILAPETIEAIKPLSAKGSLETVSKLIRALNEVMNYAVNTGRIHHNPLAGIRTAFETQTSKNMPTLSPEELPELMNALSYATIKITTRCLIEWQLHTMVRPREAAETEWDEIDFDNSLWNIPAERMKMKRGHSVPLTEQSLAILSRMKPISGHRKYIFPADRKPSNPSNAQTANMALKRMGFKGRLVAHGMRALASTTLNEQGFDSDVIEAALAHVDKNEVRRAYNHATYLERRRKLMFWWSEYIESAATGKMNTSNNIRSII